MPAPQFNDSFLKPETEIATGGSPEGRVINIATRPQFTEDFLKPELSPETNIDMGKVAELRPLSDISGVPVESL